MAKHPSIANLDVARGPQNTVELRIRHTHHYQMDPNTFRYPPSLVLLCDSEVDSLISLLRKVMAEPSPTARPKATAPQKPEPFDHEDLA